MADNLFFVDDSTGVRKTYEEFVSDVNTLECVPTVYSNSDQYQLLVTLVAALCTDQHLSLRQFTKLDNENTGTEPHCVQPNLRLSELWSRILISKSKIGLFTSGTTGRANLIQHRVETLVRAVKTSPHHRTDVWGLTYHPASFAGLQVVLQALGNCNPLIRLAGLESRKVHEAIHSMRVTHISATPTWLRLYCSDGVIHDSVTHITSGGEIADRGLLAQVHACFPTAKIRNIYASTESGSVLNSDGDVFRVPTELADRVKVIDGDLAIHRSLLADSLQESSDPNGFYLTGDCVEIESESPLAFRFLARRNDWINVGGNKVNPHEIERLLMSMQGILEARVFGRKNSVVGSIVCCEIVRSTDETITQADIRRGLERVVAPFMVPRVIEFVDAIDKTQTGKKVRSE